MIAERNPAAGRKPDRASAGQAAPPEGQRAAASGTAREADLTPRLAITPPPLCDFNPKLLTTKQRRALLLIGLPPRLYRNSGNRYGRHPSVVAYDTVMELVGLTLVRIDRNTGPHPFPVLSGAGRQVRAVLMARKQP